MNFKAFQKKILSDIAKGFANPYLYYYNGDSVLLINSGHSCIMSVPKEQVVIPLDKKFENDSLLRLIKPKNKPTNILPCFEGKIKYLFIDETNKQIFFDSKLIAHFVDKGVKLCDYDLKYHENKMYFYHKNVFVGCVLRLRSEPISLDYKDLVEAEEKAQNNRR